MHFSWNFTILLSYAIICIGINGMKPRKLYPGGGWQKQFSRIYRNQECSHVAL